MTPPVGRATPRAPFPEVGRVAPRAPLLVAPNPVSVPKVPGARGSTRPTRRFAWVGGLRFFLLCCLPWVSTGAEKLPDETLTRIQFDQRLNAQVPPNLKFHDESGREVGLEEYLHRKPIVLVLGYYECPMLCSQVLNGLVESASDMKWSIGREFYVVNVSINPADTPQLAAGKKRAYLKRYGRSSAAPGWHFLTGSETAVRQLADQVGFRYAYDPVSKQYAHPSGLVILTPEGKISQYLFGVTYSPKELYEALHTASLGAIGSSIRQLFLLCFHYNPTSGKYSQAILWILRAMGILTLIGLLGLVWRLARPNHHTPASASGNIPSSPIADSSRANPTAALAHSVAKPGSPGAPP